jgi:membrane fusion protein (multidrug efflux system)
VTVARAETQPVVAYDLYEGTVVALQEVELRAEVSGYLTEFLVADGQRVRRGQPLYAIDPTRYQAVRQQAQSQVLVAQAAYGKAAQDAERYERLAARNAVARQRVDYARADLATAAAQVTAARSGLTTARTDENRAVLRAPFAGTIGIAQVKRGSLVTPGTTLLNVLSADNPLAVDVAVSAALLPRLVQLLRQPPPAADSVFTLRLPGSPPYPVVGRLVALDRAADPQTGTVRARVQFANPDGLLRPGLTGTLRVRNADTGPQLTIPYKAVTEQMGEFYVFVVGDSNKVARRGIRLGTRVEERVVVRQGLKTGETLVLDGSQNLRDGAKVRLAPASSGAAAAGPAAR